jgi:beta-glucosidase
MTLDERIGQMTQVDMRALKNKSDIQKYSLGSVLSGGSSDPADNSLESWLKAVANSTRKNPGLIYVI